MIRVPSPFHVSCHEIRLALKLVPVVLKPNLFTSLAEEAAILHYTNLDHLYTKLLGNILAANLNPSQTIAVGLLLPRLTLLNLCLHIPRLY